MKRYLTLNSVSEKRFGILITIGQVFYLFEELRASNRHIKRRKTTNIKQVTERSSIIHMLWAVDVYNVVLEYICNIIKL